MPMPHAAVKRADRTGRNGGDAMDMRGETVLMLVFPATAQGTRHALRDVRGALTRAGLAPEMLSRVETVLAEVLNNVAEHACDARPAVPVRLTAELRGSALRVRAHDRGRPMPGGVPPAGALPKRDVPRNLLPEGGFGWFLIREQSDSLFYRRADGENTLELQFRPRAPR